MILLFSKHELKASLIMCISASIVGYAKAYTDYGKPTLAGNSFLPNQDQIKILYWIMPIMSIISALIGGYLIENYGRKKMVYCQSFGFFFSFIIMAESTGLLQVLIGRAICGFCIGVTLLGISVYLIESLNTRTRGMLSVLPIISMNCVETFVHILYSLSMDWDIMAYIPCSMCASALVLLIFIPDSPRWYIINKRQLGKAEYALIWLRSSIDEAGFEFRDIIELCEISTVNKSNFFGGLRLTQKFTAIAICFMFLQQILKLYEYVKIPGLTFIYHSTLNSFIDLIGSIICISFIEKVGRKIILLISFLFTCISLILSILFKDILKFEKYFGILLNVLYTMSVSIGLDVIPWIIMGEISPSRYRYITCSLAIAANFIGELIAREILLTSGHGLGIESLRNTLVYIGILIFGVILFFNVIPETTNRSLEEIEFDLYYSRN